MQFTRPMRPLRRRIRRGTYLNVILTVNAMLLTGLLWTQVADQPVFADAALAQSRSQPNPGDKSTFYRPNAAAQRDEQTTILQDIRNTLTRQTKMIETGGIKVQVTNLDEIKIEKE